MRPEPGTGFPSGSAGPSRRRRAISRPFTWVLVLAGAAIVLTSAVMVLVIGGNGQRTVSSKPSASALSNSPQPSASASNSAINGAGLRSNLACPLPRHPDASCTGVPVGTALSVVTGDVTVTTPNTVIDGEDIRGCVRVKAPGVVIRRSKISCSNFIVVASFHGEYSGTGLLIEDSEISCNSGPGTGVADTNVVALRLNVHGCENGFSIDSSVQISDSYVHDLYTGGDSHPDDVEMEGGSTITVSHNTLLVGTGGNSAIITDPTKMSNVTISSNLIAGGAYTLFCPRTSSSNVSVLDNRVSRMFYPAGGEYGPWTDCEKVARTSGNKWDDTGQPLTF